MMGIFIKEYSIGYMPIPKIACTSMKESFYDWFEDFSDIDSLWLKWKMSRHNK